MTDFRAIVIVVSGDPQQIDNVDTLVVGAGSKTLAGNYNLSAGSGLFDLLGITRVTFTGAGSPRSILTNVAAATDALTVRTGNATAGTSGALALGSGTAPAGFASGAVSLTTGACVAASGALNIDVGASAAPGPITMGTLVATSITIGTTGGTLVVDGTTLTLKTSGVDRLIATASTLTIQTGTILTTTGTGTIDLPSTGGGSTSNFRIAGTAISGVAVTAANFNKIFDNSNADGLHFHSGLARFEKVAGEALPAGAIVALDNNAGTASVFLADADGASAARQKPVGFVATAFAATTLATVFTTGKIAIPDAQWIAGPPVAADAGKNVYLSATPGKITFNPTVDLTAVGATLIRVGVVAQGGVGTSEIAIEIGDAVATETGEMIPFPEARYTADGTRASQTTLEGASFRLHKRVQFNRIVVAASASNAGAMLRVLIYQTANGLSGTANLKATVTAFATGAGAATHTLTPAEGIVTLEPGLCYVLFGRENATTNTMRSWTNVTVFLLDSSVPAVPAGHPTTFSTTIAASGAVAATFDPLVAPTGAATPSVNNVALLLRLYRV